MALDQLLGLLQRVGVAMQEEQRPDASGTRFRILREQRVVLQRPLRIPESQAQRGPVATGTFVRGIQVECVVVLLEGRLTFSPRGEDYPQVMASLRIALPAPE
jgi:hypothetical protein